MRERSRNRRHRQTLAGRSLPRKVVDREVQARRVVMKNYRQALISGAVSSRESATLERRKEEGQRRRRQKEAEAREERARENLEQQRSSVHSSPNPTRPLPSYSPQVYSWGW
jgi:hypothetical protein